MSQNCDFKIDEEKGTITLGLNNVSFGQTLWICNNLPKHGVPGLGDHMGPYWVSLLAANLRAYVGREFLEAPDIDEEAAEIRLTLTVEARGGGVNTMTDVRNWVIGYLRDRARIQAPVYR